MLASSYIIADSIIVLSNNDMNNMIMNEVYKFPYVPVAWIGVKNGGHHGTRQQTKMLFSHYQQFLC